MIWIVTLWKSDWICDYFIGRSAFMIHTATTLKIRRWTCFQTVNHLHRKNNKTLCETEILCCIINELILLLHEDNLKNSRRQTDSFVPPHLSIFQPNSQLPLFNALSVSLCLERHRFATNEKHRTNNWSTVNATKDLISRFSTTTFDWSNRIFWLKVHSKTFLVR